MKNKTNDFLQKNITRLINTKTDVNQEKSRHSIMVVGEREREKDSKRQHYCSF